MLLNAMTKKHGMSEDGERMPVLFLGHGSPMNAIEENEFVRGWRTVGRTIPRPNACICISAHWETSGTSVTAMDNPRTIHDFGGFPDELFAVQYNAPGSPDLAEEIRNVVLSAKLGLDETWGLDHGCWSVVKHLYPGADVPVVQISLDCSQSPTYHYELAKELAPFRKKGVLIIGSGNMVHNLKLATLDKLYNSEFGYDWTIEASEKMKNSIRNGDHERLINYKSQGSAFDLAVPTPEHFLPLLYALALQGEDETVSLFNDKAVAGSLTMTCVRIGNA